MDTTLQSITVKAPMRIALGGGGTDLPSYAEKFGGDVLSVAIDKYVTVEVVRGDPRPGYIDLAAKMLERLGITQPCNYWAISWSDLPAGSGMGGSGAYCVAFLMAMSRIAGMSHSEEEIAEMAWDVERDRGVGKHDQYMAAFGGIQRLMIGSTITRCSMRIPQETAATLQDSLGLYKIHGTRSASDVLKAQIEASGRGDMNVLDCMHVIKECGRMAVDALLTGDMGLLAESMRMHWDAKRRLPGGIAGHEVSAIHELGMASGAVAGKLVGAGGCGCMLFMTDSDEAKERVRVSMGGAGLKHIPFRFEMRGAHVC